MPTQLIAENTIPNFLLKLWKLVEDEQYRQCIQWDDVSRLNFFLQVTQIITMSFLSSFFRRAFLFTSGNLTVSVNAFYRCILSTVI